MLTHGAARANVWQRVAEIINIHHLRRKKWGGSSRPCRPASDGLELRLRGASVLAVGRHSSVHACDSQAGPAHVEGSVEYLSCAYGMLRLLDIT